MIYNSVVAQTSKILVDGKLNSQDIKRLHRLLEDSHLYNRFEISFVDVEYISALLLKDLYRIKNKATITTNTKSLWFYLSKLKIKNCYNNCLDDRDKQEDNQIKAIAIGGSAGSMQKIISLIESLPYVDITVFITIHLLPDKKSKMIEILQNKTIYKVYETTHNTKVEKNCIYIAPPNYHLIVSNGFIYLNDDNIVSFARPSINVMFNSLTMQYKSSLLAILLCGYGNDGTDSLKNLQKNGSTIIIEEPTECEAQDMLKNAIKSNNYTKILHCEDISNYLQTILYTDIFMENEIENILKNIFDIYGYDFRHYERKHLIRRLEFFMQQNNLKSFKQFEQIILDDTILFRKLLKEFSINTTNFFRNPFVFQNIAKEILPLLKNHPYIRVWSAGCSRGDEAYSIAIMFQEAGLLEKLQIYATDFNETILNEARNGIFQKELLNEFRQNYIQYGGQKKFESYFEINEDFIEIKQELKDKILFFEHNLVTDGSINEFHLIFCRNVLIYFDKTLQKKVFKTIDNSLMENGFLVLGESEMADDRYNYKIVGNRKNKIYHKEN